MKLINCHHTTLGDIMNHKVPMLLMDFTTMTPFQNFEDSKKMKDQSNQNVNNENTDLEALTFSEGDNNTKPPRKVRDHTFGE